MSEGRFSLAGRGHWSDAFRDSALGRLCGRMFGPRKLRFEPLHAGHAARISALHRASFARGWDPPEVAGMLGDRSVVADGLFEAGDRQPNGFILSRVAADEAEILTIALDPAIRGRGLSARLLAHHLPALQRRGVARLFLEVEEGNTPAERLYRSAGFVAVGAREGYYAKPGGAPARALVMRLDL
jgi:ribosomal-protein-alanine N-acetyltransferase